MGFFQPKGRRAESSVESTGKHVLLTNPWHAAWASLIAFTVGALLPLLAIQLPAHSLRVPVTFVAVVIALAITGSESARLGGAPRMPAVARNVGVGVIAMAITYGVGLLVGTSL